MSERKGEFDRDENYKDENQWFEFDKSDLGYYDDRDNLDLYGTDKNEYDINYNNKLINDQIGFDSKEYDKENMAFNMEEKDNSKDNENKHKQSFQELNAFFNNPLPQSEELPLSYESPQDNRLFEKQLKPQLKQNTENNLTLKKKKKSKVNKKKKKKKNIKKIKNLKFIKREKGRLADIKTKSSTNYRKIHDKFSLDNRITKIKSFIFKVLILAFNKLSEKLTKTEKYHLHKISGKLAYHGTVDSDKELMKKHLKIIFSDTKDDYNKNIINEVCQYKEIDTFLKLRLEDIFNYLRITETNKINEIGIKDQDNFCFLDNLNLYSFYQNELNKRNNNDIKIIEGKIKEDFVKIINGRKSKTKNNNK